MPNHGGKREGSGNKPKAPGTAYSVRVFGTIKEETAKELDSIRGNRKRSDMVREAVELLVRLKKEGLAK